MTKVEYITDKNSPMGIKKHAKKSWDQPLLCRSEAMFLDLGLDPIVIMEAVLSRHINHQGYNHREKCQIGFSEIEAVYHRVNQWE
jgi:hypothetical protein